MLKRELLIRVMSSIELRHESCIGPLITTTLGSPTVGKSVQPSLQRTAPKAVAPSFLDERQLNSTFFARTASLCQMAIARGSSQRAALSIGVEHDDLTIRHVER